MKSLEELKVIGVKLAEDLRHQAYLYHVKSRSFDVYDWETMILLEHLKAKEEAREPVPNLRNSELLSESGSEARSANPELSRRVREFYRMLSQQ
jgi:hypothetical protein